MKKFTFIVFLILLSVTSYSQINLDSGLVTHYPFSQNSLDESGNQHHGVVNSATLTQDFFGNDSSAYFFDGIDDYIEVPNSPELDFEVQETFAISLLFKAEDVVSGETSSDLVSKWNSMRLDTGYAYGIRMSSQLAASDPGQLVTVRYDSDGIGCNRSEAILSQTNFIDGKWHHLVFQLNSSNFLEQYIDGVLIGTVEDQSVCSLVNQSNLIFGNRSVDRPIRPYKGAMDEIRIYNRSLNGDEIEFLNDIKIVSSIRSLPSAHVQVTPNPVHDFLTVSSNSSVSITECKLFNISGQLVDTFYSSDYTFAGQKGVYFLQVEFANGESQTIKLVKA